MENLQQYFHVTVDEFVRWRIPPRCLEHAVKVVWLQLKGFPVLYISVLAGRPVCLTPSLWRVTE